jgi:hypothetical protein
MAVIPRAPAPLTTPISDTDQRTKRFSGYVPLPWADYFNGLDAQLAQTFATAEHVQVASGSAPIGVTPITSRILGAGVYRVSYYFVELQPDNVSSSATVTISWTDRTTPRSLSGAAVTANVITAAQTNTYLLRIDRATPITYAVAYTSTGGAPKMIFSLDVVLEQAFALP